MGNLNFVGNVAPPNSKEETKGLWNVYEDDTGKSTLETHELKTIWQSCPKDECYFELTNSPRRECTCNKCGSIAHFVLGMQALIDGKIVSLR